MDPAIPERVLGLDLIGTSEQLAHFLGIFDSSPPANASSIRLKVSPHHNRKPQEQLARFFSSSFPKLTRVNLENFLPSPSSPVFTTSSLTSLKLALPYRTENRCTLFQFSQILRRHPNLLELDLSRGAIPLPEPSGASLVSFVLPRLVTLRLNGAEAAILEFLDSIGMSSPLHTVVISFCTTQYSTASDASVVKKILVPYYGCEGSDHSRKSCRLTVSYDPAKEHLAFKTRSHLAPMSDFESNLTLRFTGVGEEERDKLVEEALPLFSLNDLQEFVAKGLYFSGDGYRGMFRAMVNLSRMQLDNIEYVGHVLKLLTTESHGAFSGVIITMVIKPRVHR